MSASGKKIKLRNPRYDDSGRAVNRGGAPARNGLRRKMKKGLLYGALLVTITYLYFFFGSEPDSADKRIDELRYYKKDRFSDLSFDEKMDKLGLTRGPYSMDTISLFVNNLKDDYQGAVDGIPGRYRALNEIESYCRILVTESCPDCEGNGSSMVDCVNSIAHVSFPERAAEMFDMFVKFRDYEKWMQESSKADSREKTAAERKEEIWRKRHELLGGEIVNELFKRQLTEEKAFEEVEKTNAAADAAPDLAGRLTSYKDNLARTLGSEEAKKFIATNRDMVVNRFLASNEVTDKLFTLDRKDRVETLAAMRRDLGFGEEQSRELAQNDLQRLEEQRKSRESLGAQYMQVYDQLEDELGKSEFDKRIRAIREQYFGRHMAETIEREERSGHYRFRGGR